MRRADKAVTDEKDFYLIQWSFFFFQCLEILSYRFGSLFGDFKRRVCKGVFAEAKRGQVCEFPDFGWKGGQLIVEEGKPRQVCEFPDFRGKCGQLIA